METIVGAFFTPKVTNNSKYIILFICFTNGLVLSNKAYDAPIHGFSSCTVTLKLKGLDILKIPENYSFL